MQVQVNFHPDNAHVRRPKEEVLAGLERLAVDFESLTAELAMLNGSPGFGESWPTFQTRVSSSASFQRQEFNQHLDDVTNEVLELLELTKQQPSKVEASPSVPCSTGVQSEKSPRFLSLPGVPLRKTSASDSCLPDLKETLQTAGARSATAKASAWRDERKLKTIEVTKVTQLPINEPMSPKMVKRAQVWGLNRARSVNQPEVDRSATAIQERIEKKLEQMFGGGQKRHQSIDSS